MKKIASVFALLLASFVCLGQTPTMLIGAEGITIASTTGTNVVYQFGTTAKFNTVTGLKLPAVISCVSATTCTPLGPPGCVVGAAANNCDPAPGIPKSIYAVEQGTAYTVTLSNGTVVNVPANMCVIPPPCVACGTVPTVPANCPLVSGSTAVAVDGQMITITSQMGPVYVQYCQGNVCNAPSQMIGQQALVGVQMNGPTGGTGPGTLYVLPSPYFIGVGVAGPPVTAVAIPGVP
jgi:hypothetical protein